MTHEDDKTGWSETALRIEQQLARNQEPSTEDLLALVAEMRDMVVPPEWREDDEPDEDEDEDEDETFGADPALSVEEFERSVVNEAFRSLLDDIVDMRNAHREVVAEMLRDGHSRQDLAALEPQDAALRLIEQKVRTMLERELGRPVSVRSESQ